VAPGSGLPPGSLREVGPPSQLPKHPAKGLRLRLLARIVPVRSPGWRRLPPPLSDLQ